uniref:Uncharacterized protein n=1 Tax=Physcomitrium patens TaxID=3218 RepID=A0A2K1K3H2_PHYPA|nr:hypothetical protein PHYPA_012811 [Physcomitrium patens]
MISHHEQHRAKRNRHFVEVVGGSTPQAGAHDCG